MASSHTPLPDRIRWQIKAATRGLVDRAGGYRRAEEITGVSDTHLQRCGDTEHDGLIGLAAVIHLERDVGRPLVTELLAGFAGYRLVPADRPPEHAPVPVAFSSALEETSALMTEAAAALADGHVSEHEARAIAAAADKARASIDGLSHSVAVPELRVVPRRADARPRADQRTGSTADRSTDGGDPDQTVADGRAAQQPERGRLGALPLRAGV